MRTTAAKKTKAAENTSGRATRRYVRPARPPKPYPKFPLFAHGNGCWTKKIDGQHQRFGAWRWPDPAAYRASWQEALDRYDAHCRAIATGQLYRASPRLITIKSLVDLFLEPQHASAEGGSIKPRSFAELRAIVTEFRDFVGADATVAELEANPQSVQAFIDDIGHRFGYCAFNKRIKLVRSLWHWAAAAHGPLAGKPFAWLSLMVERPIKDFRRQRRREREEGRLVTFVGDEVRALIDHAPGHLRAMVLLGYFASYGNTDLGELPDTSGTLEVFAKPQPLFVRGKEDEIPADWGRLFFPRPKTELDRYALIPPIVVEALQSVRTQRPKPRDPAYRNRMLLTQGGERVCYEVVHRDEAGLIERVSVVDNVGQPWRRLVNRLGHCATHGWQVRVPFDREKDGEGNQVLKCPACKAQMRPMPMRGFYVLRHTATTFATSSGASDDTRKIFEGHVDRSNPTRQTFYLDPTQLHDLLLIARELIARVGLNDSTALLSGNAPPPAAGTAPPAPQAPPAAST